MLRAEKVCTLGVGVAELGFGMLICDGAPGLGSGIKEDRAVASDSCEQKELDTDGFCRPFFPQSVRP